MICFRSWVHGGDYRAKGRALLQNRAPLLKKNWLVATVQPLQISFQHFPAVESHCIVKSPCKSENGDCLKIFILQQPQMLVNHRPNVKDLLMELDPSEQ